MSPFEPAATVGLHDASAPSAVAETSGLHVSGLAHEVLRALGSRDAARNGAICQTSLQMVVQAVLDPAAFDSPDLVERLLARGASHQTIADHYVPAAARALGDCWLSDALGFARVTVASGRLQALLGHLVHSNDVQQAWDRTTPRVALLSLQGDQHSLGWKLVTLQLRRRGVSVDALPCVSAEEGADLIERTRADLVLISASRLSVIEIVADMASTLRARMETVPPMVLGGLVVDRLDPATRFPDIVCITNDLAVALSPQIRKATPNRSRIG